MWKGGASLLCIAQPATQSAHAQPATPDVELGPVAVRCGLNAFAAAWAMGELWAGMAPIYGGTRFR